MTARKIAKLGEPILRRVAEPVPQEAIGSPELERLIQDMIDTMRGANGAGIAAPQVYQSLSVCVIELAQNPRYPGVSEIPLLVLINPKIDALVSSSPLEDGDAISVYEGCLSIPGLRGKVRRPRKVRVHALDRAGNRFEETWEGFRAAVVQHETDHLNGVLFVDRADPRTLCFSSEYEQHVPNNARIVDGGLL